MSKLAVTNHAASVPAPSDRVNGEMSGGPVDGTRVVMLGPPGSGKGTVARALAAHFGVPHVSTGALLRREIAASSALGRRVAAAVDAGELVDDDAIIEIVRVALDPATAPDGWVLDGTPRTIEQARLLAPVIEAGPGRVVAIALEVGDLELQERLLERGRRESRSDDAPEVVLHRLAVWKDTSQPLLDWYDRRGTLHRVDGTGSVSEVCARVIAAVTQAAAPAV